MEMEERGRGGGEVSKGTHCLHCRHCNCQRWHVMMGRPMT